MQNKFTAKLCLPLILLVWLPLASFSQAPTFSVDIENPDGFVCFGTTLRLTASTSNATAYVLQSFDGSTWNAYGAYSGSITSGNISINISNYTTTNTFRFKITGSGAEEFSSQLLVIPQQPTLIFQPINLRGCNNDDAFFRVGAIGSGTLQYQWQVNDGGGFIDATASTYKNANTANLEVDKLANGDDGDQFRVIVSDGDGCEITTNAASVAVNRHSDPLPTTSTEYCQGDSLVLMASNVVGPVVSYQWRMALGTGSSYQTLSNGAKYTGVDGAQLTVRDQQPDERNYQLIVNFDEVSMDGAGNAVLGTCDFRKTRRGYVINPRPTFDGTVDTYSEICEGSSLDISVSGSSGSLNWYSDTTIVKVFTGNTYSTPAFTEDTTVFIRQEDANGCMSYAQALPITVNPLPKFTNLQVPDICPGSTNFQLTYSGSEGNLGVGTVSTGTNALAGFTTQSVNVTASPFTVNIPTNSASGTYDFNIELVDAVNGCNSGAIPFTLTIKEATAITTEPLAGSACEGEDTHLVYQQMEKEHFLISGTSTLEVFQELHNLHIQLVHWTARKQETTIVLLLQNVGINKVQRSLCP